MEPLALDVVVAIDGSGSMSEPMEDLRDALTEITTRISPIATEFRVGIVVYRSRANSEHFPDHGGPGSSGACAGVAGPDASGLASVFPKKADDGRSIECLNEFLTLNLQPVSGPANIQYGVQQAIDMLGHPSLAESLTRTLVIIGDVGPYEADNNTFYPTAEHADRDASLLGLLRRFHADNPDVKVLSYFSGRDPQIANDQWVSKNYEFYESMSEVTEGTFLKDNSELKLQLLLSVLPSDE